MKNYNQNLPERSKKFLEASIKRVKKAPQSPKPENWTKAFFEIYKDEPLRKRQALSFAYALKNEPATLFDDELLSGQIYQQAPSVLSCDLGGALFDKRWEEHDAEHTAKERVKKEMPEFHLILGKKDFDKPDKNAGFSWIGEAACAPGHIAWHWNWILEEGIEGMLKRIDNAFSKTDKEGKEILEGMRISLEALLEWGEKHAEALESKIKRARSSAKIKALKKKLDICRKVPRKKAGNFREAMQAFHISYTATIFENPYGGNSPGRLDYYLWPYLEKDLQTGKETLESARELVDELFIRFHERLLHTNDGWVETIVVAGSHPDGSSAYNPLSKIMTESIASLKISHPSVYIRIPENPEDELMELAANDLANGGNRAQIINDKEIVTALKKRGIEEKDAYMYMCGGCMEVSPHGMNGDLLFTGFFNTAKILELAINAGKCMNTGLKIFPGYEKTLSDFNSFEELYTEFEEKLRSVLLLTFRQMDIHSEEFAKHRPRFLVSSQVENCIERGRGINNGGAKYEDYGSTPLGIPNIADSLTAIKTAVFEKKFIAAEKLLKALRENYRDNESLRKKLLRLPKYGEGNKEADNMANKVIDSISAIYSSYTNRLGGKIKPMIMTFNMAPVTGKALGASADGRKAGTPIAQGVTPQSCAMKHGITTAMLSANSLHLDKFSGGASSMWDLASNFATPEIIKNILKTFFKTGGHMFQGNVTDVNALKRAKSNPEEHSHLIVRVGGYSAKFTTLSPEVQDEIIKRYRHSA